jgi:hypothetical protein
MQNQIAQTILTQLGGNKFATMTGANSFSSGARALGMRLPRTPKGGFTGLRIELTDRDDYRLVFLKQTGSFARGNFGMAEHVVDGIYCFDLASAFEEATGLRVKL